MTKFKGFIAPNCTPTPDEIFDYLLPEMKEAELKVTSYIIRRTFGFKKRQDRISLNQFVKGITTKTGKVLDRGTGLSRTAVRKGLKEAIERGTIKRSVYCPHCKTEITDTELYEETRTSKNQYGEKTIKVKDIPQFCPNCHKHLRGNQKVYYSLNLINDTVLKEENGFQGFNPYRYTPTPDEIFDRFLAEMGEAECKVLFYTVRRTSGFKKSQERIPLNQFVRGIATEEGKVLDRGTGLAKPVVKRALDRAIERGTIKKLIYCPSCDSQIKDEKLVAKERTLKNQHGTKLTQVKVVPDICPFCHEKLYGREKIYYGLNIIEESKREKNRTATESLGGSNFSCPPPVTQVAPQGTDHKIQISFNDNNDHEKFEAHTSSNISDNRPNNENEKSSNAVKNKKEEKDDKPTRKISNKTQKPEKELAKERKEEGYPSYSKNSDNKHLTAENEESNQKLISEEEQAITNSIALDLAQQLDDHKSIRFFKIVASQCPQSMIYETLSIVKDMSRRGEIRTSKARTFTYLIKKETQEVGISLKSRRKKRNCKLKDWGEISDNPSKLARELAEQLEDKKGINFYQKVVKSCPAKLLVWALEEVKIQGARVRNKGALFNYLISLEIKRWEKKRAKEEKRELSSEEIEEELDELKKQLDIDQEAGLENEEQPEEEKPKPREKKEINPVLRKKLLKHINSWEYVDNLIQTHSEEELWKTVKQFEVETKEEDKRPSPEEFRGGLTKLRELEQQFNTNQDPKVEREQSCLEGGVSPEEKRKSKEQKEEERRLSPEEFKRLLSELREQVAKSEPKWEIKPPHLRKKGQKEIDSILQEKLLKGINS